MRFAEPIWLELGAVVTLLVFALLLRAERLKMRALGALTRRSAIPVTSIPSRGRRWAALVLAVMAVAMSFVALARPQLGERWETLSRKGTDLLLVVDTSRSMDADDVKPSRLERTKLAIRDLVERFPEDRIGLVAFAGEAFVQSPMTLDHGVLLETLAALDTSVVGRGGTNVARAIDVASEALASEPENQKAIVLVSDGEQLEGDALAAAKEAARRGITIDAVGVGSATGELVPAKDPAGVAVDIVRDDKGNAVRSKLDEKALRAVASAAGGTYRALGEDGRGLERLYAESLSPRAHVDASARTRRVYAERFEIPLAIALGALLAHAVLALPIRTRARRAPRSRIGGGAVASAMLVALPFVFAPAHAEASIEEAHRAYADGRWERAYELYEAESAQRPSDARLSFNAGDAAYRAGRFDAARAAYERALTHADPRLQRDVLFNQGNALFRAGEETISKARPQTIARWKEAIAAYEGAIALDPNDEDARHNLDVVRQRLAALEEEEKKSPPPPEQQKEEQQKEEQQKDDQQKEQGQQGQQTEPDQQGQQEKQDQEGGQGSRPKRPEDGRARGNADRGGEKRESSSDELSEEEARALLGSLKSEERAAVGHGSMDAHAKGAPRKDW